MYSVLTVDKKGEMYIDDLNKYPLCLTFNEMGIKTIDTAYF